MSTLHPSCQPLPAGVMAEFRPGHVVFACPQAASWWTPPHIAALLVLAALGAAAIAARRRIRDLAWDLLQRCTRDGIPEDLLRQYRDHAAGLGADRVAERWDYLLHRCTQVTVRQWLRLPKAERDRRKAEFRAADEALQLNGEAEDLAGIDEETETYHILNGRVNDLWPTVPWWCRR